EVNQKNGYVYVVGGGNTPTLVRNAQTFVFHAGIYRLNGINSTGNDRISCMAAVNHITGQGGKTMNEQWQELTGQTLTGAANWDGSSDMAIDANGNFYLMATRDNAVHALVRVEVPQQNGKPIPGAEWTYSIVKAYTQDLGDIGNIYGLSFLNGALYTQQNLTTNRIRRWDPLSGVVEVLGTSSGLGNARDMAAAQMSPAISGTIYNDANGNGQIEPDEVGVPNVVVEIWQGNAASGSTVWTKRGEVSTDVAGEYAALLNSASSEFLVRVKRPTIKGVNASQTYANAGDFYESADSGGAHNTLTPYCVVNGNSYTLSPGGVCRSARVDGIDSGEISVGTSVEAVGAGGLIVSKVNMNTDLAVVEADFGITTSASWGDAPDKYKTSNAAAGPYADPYNLGQSYLYLGSAAGVYADGSPSAAADAHSTDDGLEIAAIVDGQTNATRDWEPAQRVLMVQGKSYAFRAKASGNPDAVKASVVKAWITAFTASGPAATMGSSLLGDNTTCSATPDDSGYVYCQYTPSGALPSTAVSELFARVRVSSDPNVTVDSRGPSSNSLPWITKGEVEDYMLGVAGSVVRIKARTVGSVAANVGLSLSNVSTASPSRNTSNVLTNSGDGFISASSHAVANRTLPVEINTVGVGAAGATDIGGWKLGTRQENSVPTDTWCYESDGTQARIDTTVDAATGKLTINVPAGGQLPTDITCRLTYIPSASATGSTVAAAPSGNDDAPITSGGASDVTVHVAGTIRDANGDPKSAPVEGQAVILTLTPRGSTPATATGAHFQYNPGSGWVDAGQQYTCTVGSTGACQYPVRVVGEVRGAYNLQATIDGVHITKAGTSPPASTETDPIVIWFKAAGDPVEAKSSFTITSTGLKYARPDTSYLGADDFHSGVVVLHDAADNPITGAASLLSWDSSNPSSTRALFSERSVAGEYDVKIWSSMGGQFSGLKVAYNAGQASGFALTAAERADFRSPDATSDNSSMAITTGTRLANRLDPTLPAGPWGAHTVTVTLKDSAGTSYTGGAGRLAAAAR
ncbi:MAG: hypothetical protein LBU05_05255, partial [Bifidobacteriaceae bacterium]|nr:hypothetical protein [Bifidobacteriaceae bacterium]